MVSSLDPNMKLAFSCATIDIPSIVDCTSNPLRLIDPLCPDRIISPPSIINWSFLVFVGLISWITSIFLWRDQFKILQTICQCIPLSIQIILDRANIIWGLWSRVQAYFLITVFLLIYLVFFSHSLYFLQHSQMISMENETTMTTINLMNQDLIRLNQFNGTNFTQ